MIIEAYRRWLYTQPCITCGTRGKSIQSHVGSQGSAKRLHDETSCSQCPRCHDLWHLARILDLSNPKGWRPMTKEDKANIRSKMRDQFASWLKTLGPIKALRIIKQIGAEK